MWYGLTWLCFPVTYLALSASISAAYEIVARHKGQHVAPNESFGFAMLGLGAICAVACVGHWLTLAMLQRRLRNASRRALATISSASAIITFAALLVFSAIGERQSVKLWTDLAIYWEIGGAVISTTFVIAVWTLTGRPITQQITTG